MADSYYGFSITTAGTTTTNAYYYVSITQNSGVYDGAAVTVYPSNTSSSYFNYRSASLQWQAAAGRITAGTTVVTAGTQIIGVMGASPALNVDMTLICYGNSSTIGSVTLPAGQTEVPFAFAVTPAESIGGGGNDFLAKNVPQPKEE